MTRHERLRYEMFLRVRDFGQAHRQQFPESSTGGKAFAVLAAVAAEMEAHATTKLLTAEEGKKATTAAREAIVERLAAIARTARVVAMTEPGADRVFQLPAEKSDVALLTSARAFIREGQAVMARFVPLGLPETFVTELQQLVDALEQAAGGRRSGKTALAAAQAGIAAANSQGLAAVKRLDVVVANTFKDDPMKLAAWKRNRRVEPKGKARGQAETGSAPAGEGDPDTAKAEDTLTRAS